MASQPETQMCGDYVRLPAIPQTNCKPFALLPN
jgi:hypothetical protein